MASHPAQHTMCVWLDGMVKETRTVTGAIVKILLPEDQVCMQVDVCLCPIPYIYALILWG